MKMLRMMSWLFVLTLTGCPSTADETSVVDVCVKTGVQCRIDGAKLGVCMMNTDGTFDCASQH